MKFSEQWLREWINLSSSTGELAEHLTLIGLEVDDVESTAASFSNVVVGRVTSVDSHPEADRLRVCKVDAGEAQGELQIVCGAPNVREGMLAPLALVGSKLPDGTKVKKAKLRGVESHGMLCSAAELDLSDDAGGLYELQGDVDAGVALDQLLELDDNVIDVELTPDRGDCLSIRGIARDLSARTGTPLQLHEITAVAAASDNTMQVGVAHDCACVRYAGRIINGVDSTAVTPLWLVERLRRSGIRSINPAVDVTNYVMLELGQPMHAFDMAKLNGNVGVRRASDGEKVVLLDGREISLEADTTVITDDTGAIGIAGIMGGDSTGVDETTTDIFFEAALFLPQEIIGKPRRYDAHTESAHRFERGVDPTLQVEAMEYATSLLQSIAGGSAGPVVDWNEPDRLPLGGEILLRRERIERILGVRYEDSDVESILSKLGITLRSDAQGWYVKPPGARYDLRIEEDYIEELARIRGFDQLPRTLNAYAPAFAKDSESEVSPGKLKQLLVQRGYQEVVTFSFVDDVMQQQLQPDVDALLLANPISSDLSAMRTSLLPGLLSVLKHNLNRQLSDMKIFETGLRFVPADNELIQEAVIGGLISGRRFGEGWNSGDHSADLYDLKGDLEALTGLASASPIELQPGSQAFLHPGLSGDVVCDDQVIGWFGQLHPRIAGALDLNESPLVFEMMIDALVERRLPAYQTISRFPSVRRDLALIVDRDTTYQVLVNCVKKYAPDSLHEVLTFDVYKGENIGEGKKSIALGLILQEFSRTLQEAEVDQAMEELLDGLRKDLGVELRA